MSGLPLTPDNQPALTTAAIKPEEVITIEVGIKSHWFDDRLLVNFDVYHTDVYDFQAHVVDTGPGALRGYLANVKKVRVQGAELDASLALTSHWRAQMVRTHVYGEPIDSRYAVIDVGAS